jgi:HD domain
MSVEPALSQPASEGTKRPAWIDSSLLRHAYDLATAAHGSERRPSDGRLFVDHVVEVATLLHDAGFDDKMVAAGLLHDAVERGTLSEGELRVEMGGYICAFVLVLTEDPTIADFDLRKSMLRERVRLAGDPTVSVFAADKLSDANGLVQAVEAGTIDPATDATVAALMRHYRASTEVIEAANPGCVFLPPLRSQLQVLASLEGASPGIDETRQPRRSDPAAEDGDT